MRGLILYTTAYRESDLIVSILTELNGRIQCNARSARSSKKRFFSNLEPGLVADFQFNKKGRISYLDSASGYLHLLSNVKTLEVLALSSVLLECNHKMLVEDDFESSTIFHPLTVALERMQRQKKGSILYAIAMKFILELAVHLGLDPSESPKSFRADDFSWIQKLRSNTLITYEPNEAAERALVGLVLFLQSHLNVKIQSLRSLGLRS